MHKLSLNDETNGFISTLLSPTCITFILQLTHMRISSYLKMRYFTSLIIFLFRNYYFKITGIALYNLCCCYQFDTILKLQIMYKKTLFSLHVSCDYLIIMMIHTKWKLTNGGIVSNEQCFSCSIIVARGSMTAWTICNV